MVDNLFLQVALDLLGKHASESCQYVPDILNDPLQRRKTTPSLPPSPPSPPLSLSFLSSFSSFSSFSSYTLPPPPLSRLHEEEEVEKGSKRSETTLIVNYVNRNIVWVFVRDVSGSFRGSVGLVFVYNFLLQRLLEDSREPFDMLQTVEKPSEFVLQKIRDSCQV